MNTRTRVDAEAISRLVDGEIGGDDGFGEVVQCLSGSAELQRDWRDYHLIGDALRRSLPEQVGFDISARVSQAIEKEPSYLLPGRERVAKVRQGRRLGPAAGFALAASLAAVAVLTIAPSPTQRPAVQGAVATAQSEASGGRFELAAAVTEERASRHRDERRGGEARALPAALVAASRPRQADNLSYPKEAADLYDYLVNYNRYSQDGSAGAMLDHISLASYRR